jgi:hypothetical protein
VDNGDRLREGDKSGNNRAGTRNATRQWWHTERERETEGRDRNEDLFRGP